LECGVVHVLFISFRAIQGARLFPGLPFFSFGVTAWEFPSSFTSPRPSFPGNLSFFFHRDFSMHQGGAPSLPVPLSFLRPGEMCRVVSFQRCLYLISFLRGVRVKWLFFPLRQKKNRSNGLASSYLNFPFLYSPFPFCSGDWREGVERLRNGNESSYHSSLCGAFEGNQLCRLPRVKCTAGFSFPRSQAFSLLQGGMVGPVSSLFFCRGGPEMRFPNLSLFLFKGVQAFLFFFFPFRGTAGSRGAGPFPPFF